MMRLAGRTAVVTGAAGGIGRAIAQSLVLRGVHLALVDRNVIGLGETAEAAREAGVDVSIHVLDIGDAKAIEALPAQVLRQHPGVDLLVNNAGVALGGTFEDISDADFEWLFAINFWGVVRMTRAFLPLLRQADEARLVNMSSLFGLIAPPGQSAYSASKFAVRGFSDVLRKELAGSRVGVTVVHPGGVATRISADARRSAALTPEEVARNEERYKRLLKLSPERAGEIIVKAIERRKARVLVGSDARLAALIERIAPVSYWRLIGRGAR